MKKKEKMKSLIKSLYVPKDILHASFENMDMDDERTEVIKKALAFVFKYKEGRRQKGCISMANLG